MSYIIKVTTTNGEVLGYFTAIGRLGPLDDAELATQYQEISGMDAITFTSH